MPETNGELRPKEIHNAYPPIREEKTGKGWKAATPNVKKTAAEVAKAAEPVAGAGSETSEVTSRIERSKLQPGEQAFSAPELRAVPERIKSGKAHHRSAPPVIQKRIHHVKSDIIPYMTNIYKAGQLAIKQIRDEFVKELDQIPGLSEEQKQACFASALEAEYDFISAISNAEVQLLNEQDFKSLGAELRPDEARKFKGISLRIQSFTHSQIEKFSRKIAEECLKVPGLQPEAAAAIKTFAETKAAQARDIEGVMRYDIVHSQPIWDPRRGVKNPMAFTSSTGEGLLVVSTIRSAGPAYSSQAPRNRKTEDAYAPNFFRSGLVIKGKVVYDVVRHAHPSEFDQKDSEEKQKATEKILQQVVDDRVNNWLENLSKTDQESLLSATDPSKPLVFKMQTVNFLTPDVLRSLATESATWKSVLNRFSSAISGARADNERALLEDNMDAHQALTQLKGVPYLIRVPNDTGEMVEKTVYVDYDLRYFNIPNNNLSDKLPDFLTHHSDLVRTNQESWKKLGADAEQQIGEAHVKIQAFQSNDKLSSSEKNELAALADQLRDSYATRKKIADSTIKSGNSAAIDLKFKAWQKEADGLVAWIKEVQAKTPSSPEFQEALALLQDLMFLQDLYLDTGELFLSGRSKDLLNMDNNRSALAARLVLLPNMIAGMQVGMSCRSAKDRTNVVDTEAKLLVTLAHLEGRVFSYREVERLPGLLNHRNTMTMESGGVFDIVKANMGASIGTNTKESALLPRRGSQTAQQQQEINEASEAFAKMASRAPTERAPKAGFLEVWAEIEANRVPGLAATRERVEQLIPWVSQVVTQIDSYEDRKNQKLLLEPLTMRLNVATRGLPGWGIEAASAPTNAERSVHIINEMKKTEKSHTDAFRQLFENKVNGENFIDHLKANKIISGAEHKMLMQAIEKHLAASAKMLDILARAESEGATPILTELTPQFLRNYYDTLKPFAVIMEYVLSLSDNPKFQDAREKFSHVDVAAIMIRPVQRGPRIELMLNELSKRYEDAAGESTTKALESQVAFIRALIHEIDLSKPQKNS